MQSARFHRNMNVRLKEGRRKWKASNTPLLEFLEQQQLFDEPRCVELEIMLTCGIGIAQMSRGTARRV
jgi:hypothetical protein